MVSYTEGVELVTEPNPQSWSGAPPTSAIKWVAIETPADRLAALRSGAADLATRLTGDALDATEICAAEILENTGAFSDQMSQLFPVYFGLMFR